MRLRATLIAYLLIFTGFWQQILAQCPTFSSVSVSQRPVSCNGGTDGVVILSFNPVTLSGAFAFRLFFQAGSPVSGVLPITGSNAVVSSVTFTGTIATGSYDVRFTRTGCINQIISGSLIDVQEPQAPDIIFAESEVCSDQENFFIATDPVPPSGAAYISKWYIDGPNASAINFNPNDTDNFVIIDNYQEGSYTAFWTVSVSGCSPLTSAGFDFEVKPKPTVNTPLLQTVCSGFPLSYTIGTSVAGVSYQWVRPVRTGISNPAGSGTSALISETLTNTTILPVNVFYNITLTGPASTNCKGIPAVLTVTVLPTPQATATPNTVTVCSGVPFNVTLTSNLPGTTFNWTVNPGAVVGLSNGSGSLISQTPVISGVSGNFSYLVVPQNSLTGCSALLPITVTGVANPLPTINGINAPPVCGGSATNITFTGAPATPVVSWISTFSTSGNTATLSPITEAIANLTPTTLTGIYTLTPSISGTGCVGQNVTVTQHILPIPTVTSSNTFAPVCSGQTLNYSITGNFAGIQFDWQRLNNASILEPATVAGGNLILETLTSTASTPVSVTYLISVTSNVGCKGNVFTLTGLVNPTPSITGVSFVTTICSGQPTNVALTSNISGTVYTWTGIFSNVTGISSPTTTVNSPIGSSAVFASGTQGNIQYTVRPVLGACIGTASVVSQWVNPEITVNGTNFYTICSGNTVNLSVTGNAATYTWAGPNLLATTGNNVNAQPTAIGNNIYNVRGILGDCFRDYVITVNVNLTPTITGLSYPQTICSGSLTNLVVSATGTNTFLFSRILTNVSGVGSPSTVSSPINFNPVTTTDLQGSIQYNFTAVSGICVGNSTTVSQLVNPIPTISGTNSYTICQGNSQILSVVGNALNYTWQPATGLNTTVGSTVVSTATSSVIYTVTGSFGNCQSSYLITLNVFTAGGIVTASNPAIVCPSGAVSVSATVAGATLYRWFPGDVTGQTITVNPTTTGLNIYTVIGITGGVCSTTGLAQVTVSGTVSVSGAPSIIGALPNPRCQNSAAVYAFNPPTFTNATSTGWAMPALAGSINSSGVITTWNPAYSGVAVITFTAFGCGGSQSTFFNLTVNPVPVLTVTSSVPTTICNGTMAVLTATGADSYFWGAPLNVVSQVVTVNPSVTTTYNVTGSFTGNNCASNPVNTTITVNPTPNISGPSVATLCVGSNTVLGYTGVGVSQYDWYLPTGVLSTFKGSNFTITGAMEGIEVYSVVGVSGAGCPSAMRTITVTTNALPTASGINATTICAGNTAVITIAGNATTYTWSATGGISVSPATGTLVSVTGTSNGNLSVTALLNGCTQVYSAVVTVNPSASLTLSGLPASTICQNTLINIYAGSNPTGATITWIPTILSGTILGANSFVGNNLSGTLTSTGTSIVRYDLSGNLNGCTTSPAQFALTIRGAVLQPTTFLFLQGSDTRCQGSGFTVMRTNYRNEINATTIVWSVNPSFAGVATISGGTQAVTTVNWNASYSGNATVTATAFGCDGSVKTISTIIGINPIPTVTAAVVQPPTSCNSSDGIITVNGVAGSGVVNIFYMPLVGGFGSLITTSGNTFAVITGLGANTYNLFATNNGCISNTITSNVVNPSAPLPPITLAAPSGTYCSGQSIPGFQFTHPNTATGVIGIYRNNSLLTTTSLNTFTLQAATAIGINTYEVNITISGCASLTTLAGSYTVNTIPSINVSALTPTICGSGIASLTATGATTYTWQPGNIVNAGVLNTSIASTTTFTVTGTSGGCSSAPRFITVTVNSLPIITISPANPLVCSGNSAMLTATGGNSYVWSNGSTTGIVNTGVLTSNTPFSVTGISSSGCSNTAFATVSVVSNPVVSITPPTNVACVGDVVTLTGSSLFTYNWNNGQGNQPAFVVSVTSIGNQIVTLTGTNINGCTGTATATVTGTPVPNLTITANKNVFCSSEAVMLTATGAFSSVQWQNLSTNITENFGLFGVGVHSVTATAFSGSCSVVDSFVFTVVSTPNLTISAQPNPICAGSTVNFTVTGTTAERYIWLPDNVTTTSAIFSTFTNAGQSGGTQTFTVTGVNGNICTDTKTIAVNLHVLPSILGIAGNNPSTCTSADGQIIITLSGIPSFTVQYGVGSQSGGVGVNTISALAAATYPIVVFDGNTPSCSVTGGNITLTAPGQPTTPVFSGGNTYCANETIMPLVATTTVTGAIIGIYNTPTVLPSTLPLVSTTGSTLSTVIGVAGSYYAAVVQSGCVSPVAGPQVISINGVPTVTGAASQAICEGETVNINLSGASTYQWQPGSITGANVVLSPATTTNYTVTGITNGCTSEPLLFTITVNSIPTLSITQNPTGTICGGNNVTLSGLGAVTYTWQPGSFVGQNYVVNPSTTTVYTLLGNSLGCTTTTTFTLMVEPTISGIAVTNGSNNVCVGSTENYTVSILGGNLSTVSIIPSSAGSVTGISGNTATVSWFVPGNHTLSFVGVDACGNSLSTAFPVAVNALPNASFAVANHTICGTTASLNLNVSGGGFPYTVFYTDGSISYSQNISASVLNVTVSSSNVTFTLQSITGAGGCAQVLSSSTSIVSLPETDPLCVCNTSAQLLGGGGVVCEGGLSTFNLVVQLNGQAPLTLVLSASTGSEITFTGLSNGVVNNLQVSPTATTTYTIAQVLSQGTCPGIGSGSVTVTVSGAPVLTVASPVITCTTTSIDLADWVTDINNVPGTLQFYSDGGFTNQLPGSVVNTSGTYYALKTTTASCTGFALINVNFKTPATATLTGGGAVCENTPYNIFVQITGGVAPYSFQIGNSTFTGSFTSNSTLFGTTVNGIADVYTINGISDGDGCTLQTFGTVNVPLLPASVCGSAVCAASASVVADNTTICAGDDVTLTFTANGVGNKIINYSVTGLAGVQTITVTGTTNTTLLSGLTADALVILSSVSDATCSQPAAGVVPITVRSRPTGVSAINVQLNCNTAIVSWPNVPNTLSYEYLLSAPSFVLGTTANNSITFTGLPQGSYVVSVSAVNACGPSSITSTNFSINTPPISATITGGGEVCIGTPLTLQYTLSGVAPFNVTLADGSSLLNQPANFTRTVVGVNAIYSVTGLTDATGCSTLTESIGTEVRTILPRAASVSVTAPYTAACQGSQFTFTATGINGGINPTYTWLVNGIAVSASGANVVAIEAGAVTLSGLNDGDIITSQMFADSLVAACTLNASSIVSAPTTIQIKGIDAEPYYRPTSCNTASDGVLFVAIPPYNIGRIFDYSVNSITGQAGQSFTVGGLNASVLSITITDINNPQCTQTLTTLGTGTTDVLIDKSFAEPSCNATNGYIRLRLLSSVFANYEATVTGLDNSFLFANSALATNEYTTISGLGIGRYVLQLSYNNCVTSADTIILGGGAAPVIDLGPDINICKGQSVTLTVAGISGGGFTWLKNGAVVADGTLNFYTDTPAVTAVYVVSVPGSNGCFATDFVTVNVAELVMKLATTAWESDTTVKVVWQVVNKNFAPDNQFTIQNRSVENGFPTVWSNIGSSALGDTVFVHGNRQTKRFLQEYRVVGSNNEQCVAAPHNLVFLRGNNIEVTSQITLEWNPYKGWSTGVKEYQVWRKLDDEAAFSFYRNVGLDTNAVFDNISEGFKHHYRILAVSNFPEQDSVKSWSNIITLNFARQVEVFNGFSPNGDGKNDFFEIKNVLSWTNNELFVFNRWGAKVHYARPYKNDWRAEGMPDGTYFYILKLNDANNTVIKGHVLIQR